MMRLCCAHFKLKRAESVTAYECRVSEARVEGRASCVAFFWLVEAFEDTQKESMAMEN